MNKSESVPIMRQAIPVGFDPMRLLKKAISTVTGEAVLRLELPYKKLWFKKSHPNGRIFVKPLQLNEKIAIYEAKVFLNQDDNVPICSFTSSVASEGEGDGSYAKKAQNEAVDNALANAGFGIQIDGRYYGSEIPVSAYPGTGLKAVRRAVPKSVEVTVRTVVQPTVVAEQTEPASQAKTVDSTAQTAAQTGIETEAKADPVTAPKAKVALTEASARQAEPAEPVQTVIASAANTVPQQEVHAANAALELLRGGSTAAAKTDDGYLPFTMGPAYNNEMPVEQIVSIMTLEQAKAVVVDDGLSKGMTMGEVAEKRPASLQFYLSVGYRKKNNILKAAAQILFNERQKAS